MTTATINRLDEAARKWLNDNPQVFPLYERFALEMLERGRRFGTQLLTERVRWEVMMTIAPDEMGYRVNNNHNAYIARLLIARHPGLSALMRTRRVINED